MNGTDGGALALDLGVSAATAVAVLLTTFGVAVHRGLHRVVDIAWVLAFSAVAAVTWLLSVGHGHDGRRLVVAAATVVWGFGCRLTSHGAPATTARIPATPLSSKRLPATGPSTRCAPLTLLLTVGSGKRLLEKHMADRPGYTTYAARTSGFLPRPPRRNAPRAGR